jgi:hypothetical protein
MKFLLLTRAHRAAVFSSIDMKTIILILAAIATMSFAMCLDAQGQRLSLPEGQARTGHFLGSENLGPRSYFRGNADMR